MNQQGQNGLVSPWRSGWQSRSVSAWIIAAVLVSAYLLLYFTEVFQPFAEKLGLRSKWNLYGLTYTMAMVVGGARYLKIHGNNRYNRVRIGVNVGVQAILAFLLPFAMQVFQGKDYYFSYFWPIKMEYLYPTTILNYPFLIVLYSVLGSLVLIPLAVWRFGKRFYCSWICGCGGLANTFGDPWRHLSDRSERAWRFERKSIYTVLALAVFSTVIVGLNWAIGQNHPTFASFGFKVQGAYGFFVGSILGGVIGTGLYPLLGPRSWCRFFCPMAALLGIIQKRGRFRIRVKEDMCISCGNCSAFCEMGIDVRAYAERNETFTRASCVGCGACAHVCPRGVLKLES